MQHPIEPCNKKSLSTVFVRLDGSRPLEVVSAHFFSGSGSGSELKTKKEVNGFVKGAKRVPVLLAEKDGEIR